MNRDDLYEFFITLLATVSAAAIARKIGYSDAAVSNVKNNNYQKGDEMAVLTAIYNNYGRWDCPVQEGREISADQCQTEQARPYSASRVQAWACCQKCERRKP